MATGGAMSHPTRESDWREICVKKAEIRKRSRRDVADAEASDDEISIVVGHIRRLARSASLEFALRVGAVIIHHFYDGQVDTWRTRGAKIASFRKLARHPGLPLSAGALYRSVALYELCERLRAPSRWEHLGASHLRVVLKLPSPVQEQLLARANAGRWTVKTLQEVVSEQNVPRSRGGRRAGPPLERGLVSMKRCIADCRRTLEKIGYPSRRDVESSIKLLNETKVLLEDLSDLLHAAGASTEEGCFDADDADTGPTRTY
jgi:hypothetical protein